MRILILSNDKARAAAHLAVDSAPDGYVMRLQEPTRTLEQNSLLFALLSDVSAQVDWYGMKLTVYDWKAIFSAALKRTKVVPGIDGGFVVVGQQTSNMTKAEFSELCELILAFGAEHDVKWTETV